MHQIASFGDENSLTAIILEIAGRCAQRWRSVWRSRRRVLKSSGGRNRGSWQGGKITMMLLTNIKYVLLTIMMLSMILMNIKWVFPLYDEHYDDEVESQAEREQLRETTTSSEVEKRPRGRSSTVESAGGHRHYHWQEVKLEGTTS